jgi:hypothetical protein
MGYFRFRRSIKILPGVRWNIGKNSTSVSIGGRGLTYTVGTKGSRTTVGIPGTGMSYTQVHTSKPSSTIPPPPLSSPSPQNPPKRKPSKVFYTLGCIMLAIWLFNKVLDQSAPRSPAGTASSAETATIKQWVEQAAKRADEWSKQPRSTANEAPPSRDDTASASPDHSPAVLPALPVEPTYSPTIRRALPVEPTAAPSRSPSETPLITTYRVVNDLLGGSLNLRDGPGSTYRALVKIKAGTGGIRIGESRPNGPTLWRKIWVGPYTGWVNQDYLETENPTP